VYVCGPAGFIEAVMGAASNAGWPAANLHREYFGVAQAPAAADGEAAFQVSLASSGKVVDVPAGTTVVEALRQCGIEVPVSCEQGVCGTCLTRVLSGEPDHRDVYLTDEERAANDQFLPCCSRSKTPLLVIDL
jgi:vanillate O-demethylase ferredoxin subunit